MSVKDRELFAAYTISQTLLDRLSNEYSNLKYLYNTLSQYGLSDCLEPAVKDQVNYLYNTLFSLMIDYDLIDEMTLLEIQTNQDT